ncbi:MAG: VOC family protein [Nocardioides sp.]|nr:VOC family protein [Nocardioides sp.]
MDEGDALLSRTAAGRAAPPFAYLLGRLHAVWELGDATAAAGFAVRCLATYAEHGGEADLDVRGSRVRLVVGAIERGGVAPADVRLAKELAAQAAGVGALVVPDPASELEVAVDALEISAVRPFWRAVLGYVDDGSGSLRDPERRGPVVWFQQMSEPRSERNRIHLDVTVDPDHARPRVEKALAAGGHLVEDRWAPMFWVLADAEGNEVCVCSWEGRDEHETDQGE